MVSGMDQAHLRIWAMAQAPSERGVSSLERVLCRVGQSLYYNASME